jgi:hypothetical protein
MDTGLPDKVMLTRADILNSKLGVTEHDFRRMRKAGVLVGHIVPGGVYRKYRRDAVCKLFGIQDDKP